MQGIGSGWQTKWQLLYYVGFRVQGFGFRFLCSLGLIGLEGQRDSASRLVMGIAGATVWLLGSLGYLLSPPDIPSRV